MVFIDLILEIVEHSWELSVAVLPVLFAVFGLLAVAGGATSMLRNSGTDLTSFMSLLVASQRDLVTQYGVHLVAGLVLGGTVNAFLVFESLLPGALVTLVVLAYAHRVLPVPEAEMDLSSLQSYVYTGTWLVMPLVALAALVSMSLLLQSVVALVFYTAVFWRI